MLLQVYLYNLILFSWIWNKVNLIHNHIEKTEDLLHKDISLEEKLRDKDPEYETKLSLYIS